MNKYYRFLISKYPISLLSGALLTLGFAPFHVYSLVFILPAVLLWVWLKSSAKQAFWTGLLFGLGFFGTGASWVEVSIHEFGNAASFLAMLITCLFVLMMALYIATLGYVFRRFFYRFSDTSNALLIFPLLWAIWEILRSILITGFPWLLLGYAQIDTPLRGFAPIIGVYGLSWVTALISGVLILIFVRRKFLPVFLLFALFGAGFALDDHVWTTPVGAPLKVSLIQGNIPQSIKWDPDAAIANIKVYVDLTSQHWSSQLIVWPEGAFPWAPSEATAFMQALKTEASKHDASVIFGAPIMSAKTAFNGLVLLGKNNDQYLKEHLVPFGEYTPFQKFFGKIMSRFEIPMSDFSPGPQHQPALIVNNIRIAPFICYEISFERQVVENASSSNILLTISDDSWFGQSLAAAQHLQIAQMRSLETGRPQLLATNTGITAFISPLGEIKKAAPMDQRVVLTESVQPMEGATLFSRAILAIPFWH